MSGRVVVWLGEREWESSSAIVSFRILASWLCHWSNARAEPMGESDFAKDFIFITRRRSLRSAPVSLQVYHIPSNNMQGGRRGSNSNPKIQSRNINRRSKYDTFWEFTMLHLYTLLTGLWFKSEEVLEMRKERVSRVQDPETRQSLVQAALKFKATQTQPAPLKASPAITHGPKVPFKTHSASLSRLI
jgi:hypothetical protein